MTTEAELRQQHRPRPTGYPGEHSDHCTCGVDQWPCPVYEAEMYKLVAAQGGVVGVSDVRQEYVLNDWRDEVHDWAQSKGWWERPEDQNIPSKLALVHSEVSEALEDYREGNMETTRAAPLPSSKPVGFPSEIADVFIRLFDLCGYLGIDIDGEVRAKMDYNRTREYRHGGKKA